MTCAMAKYNFDFSASASQKQCTDGLSSPLRSVQRLSLSCFRSLVRASPSPDADAMEYNNKSLISIVMSNDLFNKGTKKKTSVFIFRGISIWNCCPRRDACYMQQ